MADKRKKAVKVNLAEFQGEDRNALPTAPSERSDFGGRSKPQDWSRDGLRNDQGERGERGGRYGGGGRRYDDEERGGGERGGERRGYGRRGFRGDEEAGEGGEDQPSRAEEATEWRRGGPENDSRPGFASRQPDNNRSDNASDWRRNEEKPSEGSNAPAADGEWRNHPRSDAFTERYQDRGDRSDRGDRGGGFGRERYGRSFGRSDDRGFGDRDRERDSFRDRDSSFRDRDNRENRESRYGGQRREEGGRYGRPSDEQRGGARRDDTREHGDSRPAHLRKLGQALKSKAGAETTETGEPTTTSTPAAATPITAATTTSEAPKKDDSKTKAKEAAKKDQPLILNTTVAPTSKPKEKVPEKEVPVEELTAAVSKAIESKSNADDFIAAINSVVQSTSTPIPTAAKQVGEYVFPLVFTGKNVDYNALQAHYSLFRRVCNDKPSGIHLIYRAQVAWFKAGGNKAQIKEVLTKLLEEKILAIAHLLGWRDDLTDKALPGKPKALLQVSTWLKVLEEQFKEEEKKKQQVEEEEEVDVDDELDEEYASNRDL